MVFNLFKKSDAGKGLKETKSVNLPSAGSGYSLFRSDQGFVYAFTNYSNNRILADYKSIAPLAAAVDKLANAAASIPIALIDKKTKQAIPEHKAFRLISHPNTEDEQTRQAMMRALVSWKVLDGDAYLLMTGITTPQELYVLNSSCMIHQPNTNGYTGTLLYTAYNTQLTFMKNELTGFFDSTNGLQKVMKIKNFNPNSYDLEGLSEIKGLYYEVNQYLHASQHNIALIENGARPSGAFVVKSPNGDDSILSDEAFARLKEQLENDYTSQTNAGRPLLLEGGLTWQQMSVSPKDLDFQTLKAQAEEQIYKKLDIPVQLISSKQTTAGNTSHLRLEFYQNRVIPLVEEILDYLNIFILPNYRDGGQLKFIVDKDEIDVLLESRIKKRDSIEKSLIMTINEKRQIYNLEPIIHGNVVVDPNGRHIAGADAILTVGEISANTNPKPTATPKKAAKTV